MKPINMADDSEVPLPPLMSARLAELTKDTDVDYYGQGGAVEAFEAQVADFLGKECAVMFPTGTLGNQLTLQRLTRGAPARVIVHRQSHLYNDAGDNLSQLSGLTMVPLEGEGAGYSAEQLKAEISRTKSARVGARIGAVTLESPSRRLNGRRFGQHLSEVLNVARDEELPTYLDGARMLIECAWTGQKPSQMAAPFDAVYLSLYKYLGAPFGCIVAGPKALFKDIHHDRRRFGGSLYQMWMAAVLASDALPKQTNIWKKARAVGAACLPLLNSSARPVTTFSDGTNVLQLKCDTTPERLNASGQSFGLKFLPPSNGHLNIKINETWIGHDPTEIVDRLVQTLAAAEH